MNVGGTVFSQLMDFLPMDDCRKCVSRYGGNHKIQSFSCLDQFLCMAFAQLTFRESLRDIESCLRAIQSKLYHMGIRGTVDNWRMSEPHAIIGLRHLLRLPAMIADRRAIAAIYDEGLKDLKNLYTLPVPHDGVCNYYKYIAVLKQKRDRRQLKSILREQYGVALAGEVYEEPLHKQPVFMEYAAGPLPVAEDLCARHICLPVFSGMQEADAHLVLHALREVVG
jgi:dTDP-4-amino-4,6-dideoxygalactose transaminase